MSLKINWEQKIAPVLRRSGQEKSDSSYRVIIELSGDGTDEIMSIIRQYQGKLCREHTVLSSLVVEIPSSAIPLLAKSKQVKKIWSDNKIKNCKQ